MSRSNGRRSLSVSPAAKSSDPDKLHLIREGYVAESCMAVRRVFITSW